MHQQAARPLDEVGGREGVRGVLAAGRRFDVSQEGEGLLVFFDAAGEVVDADRVAARAEAVDDLLVLVAPGVVAQARRDHPRRPGPQAFFDLGEAGDAGQVRVDVVAEEHGAGPVPGAMGHVLDGKQLIPVALEAGQEPPVPGEAELGEGHAAAWLWAP